MARTRATIYTDIWNPESEFRTRSARAQRLFFLILSQGDMSLCGIVPLTVDRWSVLANDTTPVMIRKALRELMEHEYVLVDETTQEVWVRTFTKHDGVLRQPNVIVSMSRDFDAIQSPRIRQAFIDGLPDTLLDGSEDGSVHGLPHGYVDRLGVPFLASFRARVLRTRARAPSPTPSPSPRMYPSAKPSPKPPPHKTLAPEKFEITEHLREWATKNNLTSVNLENETQKFLDHHAAKGSRFADWARAWQTWIRTGDGWAKERTASNGTTAKTSSVARGADPLPPDSDFGERVVLPGEVA